MSEQQLPEDSPEFMLRGLVASVDRLRRMYTMKAPMNLMVSELDIAGERALLAVLAMSQCGQWKPDPEQYGWIFERPLP